MSENADPSLAPILKNKKGKVISVAQKTLVVNAYKKYKEQRPHYTRTFIVKHLSNMLGFGEKSICKILRAHDRSGKNDTKAQLENTFHNIHFPQL